jgi:hypothetical protein
MTAVFAFQIWLVAAGLVVASVAKLANKAPELTAERAYLTRGLSTSRGVAVWRAVAVIEVVLAIGLVVGPARRPALFVVGLLLLSAATYGVLAKVRAPDSACGCSGGTEMVSWRIPARAVLLMALIGLATAANSSSSDVRGLGWLSTGVIAAEVTVIWIAFPELRVSSLRLAIRERRALGARCLWSRRSVAWAQSQIQRTHLWHELCPQEGALVDHWRQGCWRFLAYDGEDASHVTIVYAVKLPPGGAVVRAAVVDDDDVVRASHEEHVRPRWLRGVVAPIQAVARSI